MTVRLGAWQQGLQAQRGLRGAMIRAISDAFAEMAVLASVEESIRVREKEKGGQVSALDSTASGRSRLPLGHVSPIRKPLAPVDTKGTYQNLYPNCSMTTRGRTGKSDLMN